MATEVIIPSLGEVVEGVRILKWFKSEGDSVEKGEPLLEVESEKVTVEVEAPGSGILGKILSPQGSQVRITQVVAVIVAHGEAVPDGYGGACSRASMTSEIPPGGERPTKKGVPAVPAGRKIAQHHGIDLSLVEPTGPHGTIMRKDVEVYLACLEKEGKAARKRIKASPVARPMASSQGLDLAEIEGTGRGGKIVKDDILRTIREKEVLHYGKKALETIPISGVRRAIYDNHGVKWIVCAVLQQFWSPSGISGNDYR